MEWLTKKKVFAVAVGVIVVFALVGYLTGWWSSPPAGS